MSFEALKFTTAGKTLQLQALAGESLVFTQIQVGEGSINPEDIPALTQLTSLVKAMDIGKCARADTRYTVEGSFRNDEIPHSFYYRELGVFAADPDYPNDRSKDILYAYQNAYDTAEYISISTGEIIEKIIRVNMLVGEAESVSALIDSSTVFVTRNELENTLAGYATTFDAALAQKANSADVTASLAGKSDTGHTHDDRYYTESETNTLLGDKVGVSDFNSHTNNTTVHVTAEEKAAWNGKAELTDIPTTLPADGGNADTLDGLHETSFSRSRGDISDCNNAVLSGTYNAIPATINTPYSTYWLVSVETGSNGAWIRQTATICDSSKPNETYRRLFINDKWSDSWAKVNDGGNADKLDGKHASDFSQIINLGNTSTDTKTAIGIQYKTTTYWCQAWTDYPATFQDGQGMIIAVNYKGSGTAGTDSIWCRQFYFSPRTSAKIYQRIISGTSVGEWTNIADGGNAATANTAGTLSTTSSNICLRNLSSGTAEANTTNCPIGAWYGQYEEV